MNELISNFVNTVKGPIKEVSADVIEIAIDSTLQDGLLKDLPVISYIYKTNSLVLSVRDLLFVKKLAVFFNELVSTSYKDRADFLDKNEDSERLSEGILLLIERADSIDKPRLIARLFKSYMYEKIDYSIFIRFCNLIDKALLEDIYFLKDNISRRSLEGVHAVALSNLNLCVRYTFNGGTWGGEDTLYDIDDNKYRITMLGKQFIDSIFSIS